MSKAKHSGPNWEEGVIIAAQQYAHRNPWAQWVSRGLSLAGEHALGWVVLGVLVAVVKRDGRWFRLAVLPFAAHAASIIIKRTVRRARPSHECIATSHTAGKYSFPSSHTSAAAAGAIVLAQLTRLPSPVTCGAIVAPMTYARLQQGVHYPSDLVGGAIVGVVLTYFSKSLLGSGEKG